MCKTTQTHCCVDPFWGNRSLLLKAALNVSPGLMSPPSLINKLLESAHWNPKKVMKAKWKSISYDQRSGTGHRKALFPGLC